MDRATFRALVVASMAERQQRYEATLRGMPIFRHLSQVCIAFACYRLCGRACVQRQQRWI